MAGMVLPDGVSLRHPDRLFIDGEWVAPDAPGALELVSPVTENVVGRVAEARDADMDRAVAAARKAFDHGPWPRRSVAERAALLRRMAAMLRSRHSELDAAYQAQVGALPGLASRLIALGTANLENYAQIGEAYEWTARRPCSLPNHFALLLREPVGVVAAIAPWNAPYPILIQKVAPALVAGCSVILKPAPETPLEAYILAEVAEAAGLPAGVLNLVASHREAADHLVRREGVDKISFTGSTAAGRRIASVAGERIARVTLELGGKSPAIVLADFPVERAADMLAGSITMLTGQVCAALSRIIVPAVCHEEFAAALVRRLQAVKIGDPRDPATQMGPLAMRRQRDRVEGYIARGQQEGARLVTGGGRPRHQPTGFYIQPTLFTEVPSHASIAQDEIFGPVLCLFPAADEQDAIRIANDTSYGLNAAVLTNDSDAALRIARRVHSGNVAQNGLKADMNLPFGGYKQSGVGREGGAEGLAHFLETKTVILENLPEGLA